MYQKDQQNRVSFHKTSFVYEIIDNFEQISYFIAFILCFLGDRIQSQPKLVQRKVFARPFKCDMCNIASCSTEAQLNKHKLKFHSFLCQVCGHRFEVATERDVHEAEQHNLRKDESILISDGLDSQTEIKKHTHKTNTYNLRKRFV